MVITMQVITMQVTTMQAVTMQAVTMQVVTMVAVMAATEAVEAVEIDLSVQVSIASSS